MQLRKACCLSNPVWKIPQRVLRRRIMLVACAVGALLPLGLLMPAVITFGGGLGE